MIEKLKKWLDSEYKQCYGCHKPIKDMFDDFFHDRECINKPLGYNVHDEVISPSTKVYFLREKQRRRIL